MSEQQQETTTEQPAEQESKQRPSPNAEAAKYRTRLREVEAERDALLAERDAAQQVVTNYRRTEAERAAEAAGLARGADLFDLGTQLEDLLDDDGAVDNEKVSAATEALLADRPHWRAQVPDLDLGVRGGNWPSKKSWTDVLNNR